jgi:RNA polymerase sigma factor (sigma-70 family)
MNTPCLTPSRRRLAAKHWPLALGVASWFANRHPNVAADWEGAAGVGLCRAAIRYRKGAGASFPAFAWQGARMACLDALRTELARGFLGLHHGRLEIGVASLSAPAMEGSNPLAAWAECTADPHDDLGACEARLDVPPALRVLDRRQGIVIRRRFGLGGRPRRTHEEIAGGLSLTRQRVAQIEDEALEQLRVKLGGEPVPTPGLERARAVARRRAERAGAT